jgi:hypothetical protein
LHVGKDGNDARLALDACQLVFHSFADSRVAVERQVPVGVELQASAVIFEVLRADAVQDLTSDVICAVVRSSDVKRASVSRTTRALRKEIDLTDPIGSGL